MHVQVQDGNGPLGRAREPFAQVAKSKVRKTHAAPFRVRELLCPIPWVLHHLQGDQLVKRKVGGWGGGFPSSVAVSTPT